MLVRRLLLINTWVLGLLALLWAVRAAAAFVTDARITVDWFSALGIAGVLAGAAFANRDLAARYRGDA